MLNWLYGPNLITKVDRLGTYAAALAYCFVLSLVPFLAVTFVVGMQIAAELDINKQLRRALCRCRRQDHPHAKCR